MKISMELLMKAAKFQQNHKIKADVVEFDNEDEMIRFTKEDGKEVALLEYNNERGQQHYWIEGGKCQ